MSVDISKELNDFETASKGSEVRASFVSAFRKFLTVINKTDGNLYLKGSNVANISAENAEAVCGNDIGNIPVNTIYIVNKSHGIPNLPTTGGGLIITLSKVDRVYSGATQIYYSFAGVIYFRCYLDSKWHEWTNVGEMDTTLSKAGFAADAKATGDELINLKESLGELKTDILNNNFPKMILKNQYYRVPDANRVADNDMDCTEYIRCTDMDKLYIYSESTRWFGNNAFFRKDMSLVEMFNVTHGENIIAVPSDAYYFALSGDKLTFSKTEIKSMPYVTLKYNVLPELFSLSEDMKRNGVGNSFDGKFSRGSWSGIMTIHPENNNVCNTNLIIVENSKRLTIVTLDKSATIWVRYYKQDGTIVKTESAVNAKSIESKIPDGAFYLGFIIEKNGITVDNAENVGVYIDTTSMMINELKSDYRKQGVTTNAFDGKLFGGYWTGQKTLRTDANDICNINLIPCNSGDTVILATEEEYETIWVRYYNHDSSSIIRDDKITNASKYHAIVPDGADQIGFICEKAGMDITNVGNITLFLNSISYDVEMLNEAKRGNGFVIGSDMVARPVTHRQTFKNTYPQSFCIYNGHLYSAWSEDVAKQDLTGNLIKTIHVPAEHQGHANAFQSGCKNLGYIWGWDDNKIHIINLDTMEFTGTIDLPTTGYTSGVVDDLNEIAYIFQRDTDPTINDRYNFIAYDYANNNIVYRAKTIPFTTMQDAELFGGNIIVANGGGASSMPTGIRTYNTRGEVVAEMTLNKFKETEPEGICIDRENGDMYISFIANGMHKVTAM